ncbi:MAG: AraC family transcriptional regulator [Chitinivibrionales bacterium]
MTRSSIGRFHAKSFCLIFLAVSAVRCGATTSDSAPATFSITPDHAVDSQSVLSNGSGGARDSLISLIHAPIKAGQASIKNESLSGPPAIQIQQGKKTPKAAFRFRPVARLGVLLLSIVIICMVVWFIRKTNRRPTFLSTTRLSVMDKEVQKACRYIEKNYAKPGLSIDMICSDLVTGKAFLEALFEKELGLTVDQFTVYVRINRARIFIENNPRANAETVAMETGFSAPGIFTAAFKKVVGTSFEEYRESRALREAGNG